MFFCWLTDLTFVPNFFVTNVPKINIHYRRAFLQVSSLVKSCEIRCIHCLSAGGRSKPKLTGESEIRVKGFASVSQTVHFRIENKLFRGISAFSQLKPAVNDEMLIAACNPSDFLSIINHDFHNRNEVGVNYENCDLKAIPPSKDICLLFLEPVD